MRNVLFTVALILATFVSANAQFYAGGSLGFESNSNSNPKSSVWFSPEIGYYITPKFDVGIDLGFAAEKQQNDMETSSWSFLPYARYSFYQLGKFEVIAKGSAGFTYADTFTGKSTNFRMNISPILACNLTEKIVLFTQLNFLSLTFVLTNPEFGDTSHQFRFGASNYLVNTGNLSVGFFYKF